MIRTGLLDKAHDKAGKKIRVLAAAGSSGGHIFPALSFLDALKDKAGRADSLLILPERSIKNRIPLDGYNVKYISVRPVSLRAGVRVFADIFDLLKGSLQSLLAVIEYRPDAVVGFGGIESVPLVMAAWLFRIKTLIHEQNVVPGRANRLLAKFADKVAVSFEESGKYFGKSGEKIFLSGNPIRKDMKRINRPEALRFFGLEEGRFTILVMGGSQGSRRINSSFMQAMPGLGEKIKAQAVHISGEADYAALKKEYAGAGLKVKLFAFLKEMQYAYSVADLAITRAGATTIAELSAFKVPSVLVPYPFAQKHQAANAEVLRRAGCAIVIDDEDLDAGRLAGAVMGLAGGSRGLASMRSGFDCAVNRDAAVLLAEEALS